MFTNLLNKFNKKNVVFISLLVLVSIFFSSFFTNGLLKITISNNEDNQSKTIPVSNNQVSKEIILNTNNLHALHIPFVTTSDDFKLIFSINELQEKDYYYEIESYSPEENYIIVSFYTPINLKTINCSFQGNDYSLHSDTSDSLINKQLGLKKQLILLIKLFFILFIFVGSFLVFLLFKTKLSIATLSLILSLFVGILYLFILPPFAVPDEKTHYNSAYEYSNKLLKTSTFAENGKINYRVCDTEILHNKEFLNPDLYRDLTEIFKFYEWNKYYKHLAKNITKKGNQSDYISASGYMIFEPVEFLPQIIGITVGRLLHFNQFLTFYLGRFLSLIFYSLIIFLVLKLTKCKNNFLLLIPLLPSFIQQISSYSYDGFLFTVSYCFIILLFSYNNSKNIKYLIASFLFFLLLSFAKNGLYLLLGILYLNFINLDKFYSFIKNYKNKFIFMVVLATLVICFASSLIFSSFPQKEVKLSIEGDFQSFNTIYTILAHPVSYIITLFYSFIFHFIELFNQAAGFIVGVRNIHLNPFLSVGYILILLLIITNNNDGYRFDAISISISTIILTVGIFTSMFIFEYLNYGSFNILGVQGRYFIPLLPLIVPFLNKLKISFVSLSTKQIFYFHSVFLILTAIDIAFQIFFC